MPMPQGGLEPPGAAKCPLRQIYFCAHNSISMPKFRFCEMWREKELPARRAAAYNTLRRGEIRRLPHATTAHFDYARRIRSFWRVSATSEAAIDALPDSATVYGRRFAATIMLALRIAAERHAYSRRRHILF